LLMKELSRNFRFVFILDGFDELGEFFDIYNECGLDKLWFSESIETVSIFLLTSRISFTLERLNDLVPKDEFGKSLFSSMFTFYLQPFNSKQRELYISNFIET